MPTKQGDDIQEVKLDVALIKNDIKTIKRDLDNNQKIIIDRMDKFAFVPQKEHDRDMADVRKEFTAAIEEYKNEIQPILDQAKLDSKLVNQGGLKNVNFVSGNATRLILTALALGVIVVIVLTLASTIPAVQSALGNTK